MQTHTETPPSNLIFSSLPYECEVTAALTSEFEQAVDKEIIGAACRARKLRDGVDIYLACDGTCYGRVAKNRTYVISLAPERAPLVANWVQAA